MKILVLNGSPKRDASDTMHLTRAFLAGMQDAGEQEITTVHAVDKHIEYCTGCFSCMRNGGTCVLDDDMREILGEILNSDVLLFNFPLYCYGMPAPETLKAALPYLPSLAAVELGSREDPALAAAFRAAAPGLAVNCRYTFTWMDRELSESTETLDLTNTMIADVDELRKVLSWLPALTHTEMVRCGLDDETMAALREEFPEKGIVWEISLGYWGRLRTDATAFTTRSSKSDDEMKYRLTTETLQPIRYCTELVALDLGHQKIDDISCLQGLHKLQILILADNRISDLTPLASMPDLVYVELFYNHISDLSPLSGLTKLKDLNVCSNHISDLTPLYGLTSLERLWYSDNRFTVGDHNALCEKLPGCVCNRTVWDATADGWREHERYFWMRSFFRNSPRYK